MQNLVSSPTLLTIILSSAAIGALVSSGLALIGQSVERKARRRELLLTEAVKLAVDHRNGLLEVAKLGRTEVFIPENVRLMQTYFAALSQLVLDGRLPAGILTTDSEHDKASFQDKWKR